MVTLQEQFEKKFPGKGVRNIFFGTKEINFTNYDLDLSRYTNLEKLNLTSKITSINLASQNNLVKLNLSINRLTSADFLNDLPNPEKLVSLEISSNRIQPTNIEVFNRFVNLKCLRIGINNSFYGSLKSWKNLTKLKRVCIEDTDVDEGLEYVPIELAKLTKNNPRPTNFVFDCNAYKGKVKAIQDQLRPFNYDLEAWQLANPEKMLISRPELFTNPDSKDKWIEALNKKLTESHQLLVQTKDQETDKLAKIARLEAKISELELAKSTISQQTQTEFSTQNKGTQTDLSIEQITKLEKDNQQLKKLLQATEQELINTKNQLTQSATNQEQINQLQSKIKLLEQQKTNYQTKYDNSIAFIKEIREDIAKS